MGKKIRAIVKRPDELIGHVTAVSNSLENLQRIVGGYIQIVPIRMYPNIVVICNEDGRLQHLPFNCTVTGHGPAGDFEVGFVGDIIVVGVEGDELADLPAEITRKMWASWIHPSAAVLLK